MSSTVELLRANVTPFSSIQENGNAIARYFDSFGDCKILLLGDASHGTSEFYAARAEITKYMIEHHGFNIVAVEADWPDAETVDRYVRCRPGVHLAPIEPVGEAEKNGREPAFVRFPTWMWRNMEVRNFVEWLRKYNKDRGDEWTGFYGLDLYSMSTSMREVIRYLEKIDEDAADIARERYGKLIPWADDPHEYGLETLMTGFKGYEEEVIAMLKDLLSKRLEYSSALWNGTEFHSGEQNARVVADAEKYYRAMYYGGNESWNLRDTHMFETLVRILKHRGNSSKAIVWAHNSHVGDARATSMGWSRDELNIGHLCKETYGNRALNIGCGTNTGTLAAAKRWDSDMSVMKLKPGLPNSYEGLMHATGIKNFMLDLRKSKCDERLRQLLCNRRLERSIGVIYRPDTERQSHYSSAVLPEQFDGYIWFDESRHVGTLEVHQPPEALGKHETWPFGL
ncbi:erythromycin esterase-domain-containing protein [Dactylonectria macrodidyma]|uniref:Erythromycin esterase-domain-containing protein n=1 Tax=Dactylonectria macrodidyma TaxID=307937 RepID=A0A9P9D488_9HYPO|nr:erythromycin esterase-domain-containing protein [Dactylonectria macrodidyma]